MSGAITRFMIVAAMGAATMAASPAYAQGTRADYERAAVLQNLDRLVSRLTLAPNWIEGGSRFWYVDAQGGGRKRFVMVDPATNRVAPAFDHVRLAQGLTKAGGKPVTADRLPFDRFAYVDGRRAITFSVGDAGWRCKLSDYGCASVPAPFRKGDALSPDGRRAVYLRDDNLWVRDVASGKEAQLSTDGAPFNGYAASDIGEYVTRTMLARPPVPPVVFSPDSRHMLAYRIDVRRVRRIAVAETVMGAPSRVHEYPFPNAGDADLPMVSPVAFDLETGTALPLKMPAFGRVMSYESIACWSPDARRVCFNSDTRGYKAVSVNVADLTTGEVKTPLVEPADTYIDRGYDARLVGDDLVWMSERDGWKHLYRIDGTTGQVRNQITRGEWAVRDIVHVDAKRIYFTAGGREAGEDPYQRILYSVGLDGSGLKRLTPEDADHDIAFSPDGRYFVDSFSRLDLAPVTVLRTADGRMIRELQRADITRLVATGWKPPERFSVKAADGTTDIYGAIFRPTNFDPAKRYPVLDAIYPGPQTIRTRKTFTAPNWNGNEFGIAELGFIVVTIDGRGTPFRSKAFHDVSFGKLGTAGTLEDHVAGLKQLAARHPELDLDRVGIYGHSGGGYASARAMLDYPDFYKVAVSSAGNHDQRNYTAAWGERYQGYPVGDNYLEQATPLLASRLKGKLLLVHGDMDDNVSPSHTLQLADALIAANKDFDLLIMPNRNHGMIDLAKGASAPSITDPYFIRRRWDYFVQNLMGVTPPTEFNLVQIKDDQGATP
jgi:dipeptidyl-peptidase-4